MASVTARDRVFELRYGDGLLGTTAAKFGARATVVPVCARGLSAARTSAAAVANRITVLDQDFFTVDLGNATVVILHLLPTLNAKLLPKLKRELKPGTRIVSVSF